MNSREIHREHFIKHRPRIYHVSLASGLESIKRHGLLSASALMDLFELSAHQKRELELRPRSKQEELVHPIHGKAALNDQSVLNAAGLASCLMDVTSEEWCRTLNNRVFFWPGKELRGGLWDSRLGKTYQRIVLVSDTREFLDAYESQLYAAPINVGYTMRKPSARGLHTFRPLQAMFDGPLFSVAEIKELSILDKVLQTDVFKLYEVQADKE